MMHICESSCGVFPNKLLLLIIRKEKRNKKKIKQKKKIFFFANVSYFFSSKKKHMSEEWVQLGEENNIEMVLPTSINDTPIIEELRLENKQESHVVQIEQDTFQTEDKDIQIAYFSNVLVEYVSVETSRKVSGLIVSSLRSNTRHPDLLLELMLIMKYLRVSGHVKKSLVKKIYLEVYDELDWLQRDCDRFIDQLVIKLPRSFQNSRTCFSFIPDCLKPMCFI